MTNLKKSVILLIIWALLVCWLNNKSIYAAEIKQETTGPNSPASYAAPGGKINVTIGIPAEKVESMMKQTFSEIRQEFSKCLDIAVNFQNKKLDELNNQLSNLYVQNSGASNLEARKWAEEIVEKSPEFLKQQEEIEKKRKKYNSELSKKALAETYQLFDYVFRKIDSRFVALRELNPKDSYEIHDKFVLFIDESSKNKRKYIARTYIFHNANMIQVKCSVGITEQALIRRFPHLRFEEINNKDVIQTFSLIPNPRAKAARIIFIPPGMYKRKKNLIRNIEYIALNDRFRKEFDRMFNTFIKLAYTK